MKDSILACKNKFPYIHLSKIPISIQYYPSLNIYKVGIENLVDGEYHSHMLIGCNEHDAILKKHDTQIPPRIDSILLYSLLTLEFNRSVSFFYTITQL